MKMINVLSIIKPKGIRCELCNILKEDCKEHESGFFYCKECEVNLEKNGIEWYRDEFLRKELRGM